MTAAVRPKRENTKYVVAGLSGATAAAPAAENFGPAVAVVAFTAPQCPDPLVPCYASVSLDPARGIGIYVESHD